MQQTFSYRVALFNEDIVDEITDVDKGISGNVVDDVVAEVVNVDQTNLGAAIIQEINIEDALEDCEGFDLKSSLVVYSEGFLRCG